MLKFLYNIRYYKYLKFKKKNLKKHQAYHKAFDHFYFKDKIFVYRLKQLINDLTRYKDLLKRLPKSVADYRSFHELRDDIYKYVTRYQNTRDFLNSEKFPKHFKKHLKKEIDKFVDIYYQDRILFDHDLDHLKKYTELLKFLKLKGICLSDERDTLLNDKILQVKKIKDCKILHTDLDKKMLIIEVNSFAAMQEIGHKSWCITNDERSWDEYVNIKKQVIVWNFSIIDSLPKHCIGITFNLKKKNIIHAYSANNEKIKTGKVYKYIHQAYGTKIHN